jgi:hypothetical protein
MTGRLQPQDSGFPLPFCSPFPAEKEVRGIGRGGIAGSNPLPVGEGARGLVCDAEGAPRWMKAEHRPLRCPPPADLESERLSSTFRASHWVQGSPPATVSMPPAAQAIISLRHFHRHFLDRDLFLKIFARHPTCGRTRGITLQLSREARQPWEMPPQPLTFARAPT